jgi:hypothetical protein
MSADVYIGTHNFNFTNNTSALWYDHIPDSGKGGGLREIHGLTGKQAFQLMSACMTAIDDTRCLVWELGAVGEPEFCKRYDSPNGWGSAVGGILFLARIMAACAENPRKRVSVCL